MAENYTERANVTNRLPSTSVLSGSALGQIVHIGYY